MVTVRRRAGPGAARWGQASRSRRPSRAAAGRAVPRDQAGEFCTRGYSVMKGYWNDEDNTREAIDEAPRDRKRWAAEESENLGLTGRSSNE